MEGANITVGLATLISERPISMSRTRKDQVCARHPKANFSSQARRDSSAKQTSHHFLLEQNTNSHIPMNSQSQLSNSNCQQRPYAMVRARRLKSALCVANSATHLIASPSSTPSQAALTIPTEARLPIQQQQQQQISSRLLLFPASITVATSCRRFISTNLPIKNSYKSLLCAAILLISLLHVPHASAFFEDQQQASQPDSSAPILQLDSQLSSSSAASSKPEQKSQSIVASLSSAVASAAAAAAVAAAQNALSSATSGHDARSLSSPVNQPQAASVASGLISSAPSSTRSLAQPAKALTHLAIRQFADAIPEVPYHILHNMKKLDHAAPFYNVPNKAAASDSRKENSAPSGAASFLANALGSAANALVSRASGSGGGSHSSSSTSATEAIVSTLIKSPFWKRLAEGYGDFAAEFRSIFKSSSSPTNPIKATGSAVSAVASSSPLTAKLLRDISVPAILMLAASSLPSEWRPTKSRRKSLLSGFMSQASPTSSSSALESVASSLNDPMSASASEQLQKVALNKLQSVLQPDQQQQHLQQPLMAPFFNPMQANNLVGFQRAFGSMLQNGVSAEQQVAPSQGSLNLMRRFGSTEELVSEDKKKQALQHHSVGLHNGNSNVNSNTRASNANAHVNTDTNQAAHSYNFMGLETGRKADLGALSAVEPSSLASYTESNSQGSLVASPSASVSASSISGSAGERGKSGTFGKVSPGASRLVLSSEPTSKITSIDSLVKREGEGLAVHLNDGGKSSHQYEHQIDELTARSDPGELAPATAINERHRYTLLDTSSDSSLPQSSSSQILQEQPVVASLSPSARHSTTQAYESKLSQQVPSLKSAHVSQASVVASLASGLATSNPNPNPLANPTSRAKPFLLSAMNHAMSSMLHHSLESGYNPTVGVLQPQPQVDGRSLQQPTDTRREQRDLSQLLPQTWRDAVKRTYNSVQQSASNQWRSFEGQVSNWVQDKLKPTSSSSSITAATGGQQGISQPGTGQSLFGSVSSTALNILGLSKQTQQTKSGSSSSIDGSGLSTSALPVSANTTGTTNIAQRVPGVKNALFGMANILINTLSGKLQTNSTAVPTFASAQSTSSSTSTTTTTTPTASASKP